MRDGEVNRLRGAGVATDGDFYNLIHDLDAIIWELSVGETQFTFVSQRAEEMLGYPISRWLSDPTFWLDVLVHPDDRVRVAESTARAGSTDSAHQVEYRGVTADGRVLWLRHVSRLVRDPSGGDQRRGIIFDITEQKTAEAALRRSEEWYRSLLESISDVIAVIGSDHTVTYLSPSVERVLGYGPEVAIGRSPIEFLHPDDTQALEARLERRFSGETGPDQMTEVRFRTADGGWRVLQVHGKAHLQPTGERVIVLTGRDVTEHRRSDEELRRQRSYFARLFEGSPEAIVILDSADRVQRVNEEFSRLFGYSAEEAEGRDINDLIVPEPLHEEARSLSRRAASGGRVGEETLRVRRGGSPIDVSIQAMPIEFADGTVQIYGIYRDMTAKREAERALAESEEQLRQAQKMEAVGRLAGGVAHDFNNLLTAIQGHAQLLLDRLQESDPRREDAVEIQRSAERATILTRQLLAFSRKQILKPEPVDLNLIVSGLESMLRRLIGEEIDFVTILDQRVGRVHADPGQLEQVIMNLVVNARDAMPGGGQLSVETGVLEVGDEELARYAYQLEPGRYMTLEVRDTGTGIPKVVLDQIFEPFFTTKEPGQGTGLGLSMVYGIVQQSDGHIEVESHEGGGGTSVVVYLPQIDEESHTDLESDVSIDHGQGQARGGLERVETRAGGARVLVVEDEEAVRSLVCKVLRRQGYEVLAADSGAMALELLEREPGSVHLVVTDLVMPGMGGTELSERASQRFPGLRFLFMSGYAEDELVRRGVADGRVSLLEKPFSPGVLIGRVREVLRAKVN